jgi:hypothetical protein
MPTFRISVTNNIFSASSRHDVRSLEAASKEGLRSALAIGSDELVEGGTEFRADVCVDGANAARRFTVALSVTPAE